MGFEQAHQAMTEGLNTPEDHSSAQQEFANNQEQEPTTQQAQPNQPELTELEKLERFKFNGREWTPEDLRSAYLMQQDYTKKTQALARDREFIDNLNIDLEKVRGNPALATEFMKIYPEKYHKFLEYIRTNQPNAQANQQQKPLVDPQLTSRLEQIESHFRTQEVEKASAQIDAMFSKYSPKYPMANEELVLSRAQMVLDGKKEAFKNGTSMEKPELTEKNWEQIFKSVNESIEALAKKNYQQKVTQQMQASARSRDTAPGGAIPGQAPRKMTFKEATEHAIQTLTQERRG